MSYVIGLICLALGLVVGWFLGRRSTPAVPPGNERDLNRMLQLLGDLGTWTDEYSGNVSSYQQQLKHLAAAVRKHNAAASSDQQVDGQQLMSLLEQFITGSERVQSRLDAVECELESRTRQIKDYLDQARTDGLTGLLNRRVFDEELEKRFERFRAGGASFSLALIDVDHFKSINDTHGHPMGDGVLRQLAQWMQQRLGAGVTVARYGGDEFAVILDESVSRATERLETLRRAIAESTFRWEDHSVKVTLSIGISQPIDDASSLSVLRRADEALYAAKAMGRNHTLVDEGSGAQLPDAVEISTDPHRKD
ncbi:GGDEF domain-containing protein [Stieleria varia]|uniref:diguanylate cyclase n=1 Tax=Stieleria varia TaxID=2528005 RepID=A0A5C6B3G9_9BACT|nr:GGDEF domain-containing protein [Stieleria varia]TWU06478.1 Response regulator PleD [Stieleria varia]